MDTTIKIIKKNNNDNVKYFKLINRFGYHDDEIQIKTFDGSYLYGFEMYCLAYKRNFQKINNGYNLININKLCLNN